jgi:hypothetical protein
MATMAKKIRCEFSTDRYDRIQFKLYYRKSRCKAAATTLFMDNPKLYSAPHFEHRYCDEHAALKRSNAGLVEMVACA